MKEEEAEDRIPFIGGVGAGVCKGVTGSWFSPAVNMIRESSRGVEEYYRMEGTRGSDDDLSPRRCEYGPSSGESGNIRPVGFVLHADIGF